MDGEREKFEAALGKGYDFTLKDDAWARPIYAMSHIEAMYQGWLLHARTSLPSAQPSKQCCEHNCSSQDATPAEQCGRLLKVARERAQQSDVVEALVDPAVVRYADRLPESNADIPRALTTQQAQSVQKLVEAVQTWSGQLTLWFESMNKGENPKNRAALIAAWSNTLTLLAPFTANKE